MYIIEIPTEHNLKDKKEINVCYELPYFKYRLYTLQMDSLKKRNISGANQHLLANCANFNLGYRINIQGAWGDWVILQLTTTLLQIPLPLPLRTPLDFDPVVQIEICMVCTRLVCI